MNQSHCALAVFSLFAGSAASAQPVIWTADVDSITSYYGSQNDKLNGGGSIVFYGDEVGYSGGGVGDVNGDGFYDYAVNWYRRDGDEVGHPSWEEVGFVRIFSGRDGSQIGGDIWGGRHRNLVAHEMTWLHDIDGDGRSEVVLSGATGEGDVWVLAFTHRYNVDCADKSNPTGPSCNDPTERWVPILHLAGAPGNGNDSIGYRLADAGDLNTDGQHDLLVSSWQTNSSNGAVWAYLMPSTSFWQWMQDFGISSDNVTRDTIELTHDQYSIEVLGTTNALIGTVGGEEVTGLPDIDGDGADDFAITAPFADHDLDGDGVLEADVGKVLIFLSDSSLHAKFNAMLPRLRFANPNDPPELRVVITSVGSPAANYEMNLDPLTADIALVGAITKDGFGDGITAAGDIGRPTTSCPSAPYAVYPDFDGDCKLDLAVSRRVPGRAQAFGESVWIMLDIGQYVCSSCTSTRTVFAGDTTNTQIASFASSDPFAILRNVHTAGDVDGDGDDEIMVYDRKGAVWSSAEFAEVWDYSPSGGPVEILRVQPESFDPGPFGGLGAEDPLAGIPGDYSTGLSRFWPVWDLDGDGRDDLNITAWVFPRFLNGVATVADHEAIPNHVATTDPAHAPIVRAGKSYIVLSAPESVVTAVSLSTGVAQQGSTPAMTIQGTNLLWPRNHGEFLLDDINVVQNPQSFAMIEVTGSPSTTMLPGKPDSGTRIDGIAINVPAGAAPGFYDMTLETRHGTVLISNAFEVTQSGPSLPNSVGDESNLKQAILSLLSDWGRSGALANDLDGDGFVGPGDLLLLLARM